GVDLKKIVPAFLMLVMIFGAGTAHSIEDGFIGIYLDPSGTSCEGDIPLYGSLTVYVVVGQGILPHSMQSVEFKVNGMPGESDLGVITETWYADEVVGEAHDGVYLRFDVPQDSANMPLGEIRFLTFSEDFIGTDHVVRPGPIPPDVGHVLMISGDGSVINLYPTPFTFNCQYEHCDCMFSGVGVESGSWGGIKCLY
ncbi:MAG: hypothetical protein GY721_02200, partial [Deltaproteobacteria bacterium]|nr:hypothetical protein [Deltaproteobacteria bacterium]